MTDATSGSDQSRGFREKTFGSSLILGLGLLAAAYVDGEHSRAVALTSLALAGFWSLLRRSTKRARSGRDAKRKTTSALWPDGGMKSAVDALREPAFVIDRETALRFANTSGIRTFGNMALGDPIAMRFRAPELVSALEEATSTNSPQFTEYAERAPSDRAWSVDILPTSAPGEPAATFFIVLFRDRTQARRLERMRTDFVANASHELRTPLSSLSGFIETLKGPAKDDARARAQFLDIMQDQARRMSRLIDDLLSLSRIETRRRLEPHELADVSAVLKVVSQQMAPDATEKGMSVELVGLDEGEVWVNGDHDELVQVFGNLAENALKYGDAGKRIEIGLKRSSNTVEAYVQDFGQGIAPEHVPRLTERFYRIEDGRNRARGTGLGLSIVRNVLIRHNVRLSIASIPSEGSTFSVTFQRRAKADSGNSVEKTYR